jgi:hypothetical protein
MRFIIVSIAIALTNSRSLVSAFAIVVFIIIERFFPLIDCFISIELLERMESMLDPINLPLLKKMESIIVIADF